MALHTKLKKGQRLRLDGIEIEVMIDSGSVVVTVHTEDVRIERLPDRHGRGARVWEPEQG